MNHSPGLEGLMFNGDGSAADEPTSCPEGFYNTTSTHDGDVHADQCQPCALSRPVLWALLLVAAGLLVGTVWRLSVFALGRLRDAQQHQDGQPGVGQQAVYGLRSVTEVKRALNTLATTSNGYQFLMLFQIHVRWPQAVTRAWKVLTSIAGLAFVRLEFLATAFRSLCIRQYLDPAVLLAVPFSMFGVIFAVSKITAWRKEREAKVLEPCHNASQPSSQPAPSLCCGAAKALCSLAAASMAAAVD